eukprot:jgi/Psemu1/316806/fgenesh1_kg.4169_\
MALSLLFQPVHRLHWYNAPPFSVNLSIELLRRSLFFLRKPARLRLFYCTLDCIYNKRFLRSLFCLDISRPL